MVKKRYCRPINPSGIIIIIITLCILSISIPVISCSPQQVFGEVLICSDIDSETFKPAGIGDIYGIDSPQIIAAIRVSGVRGGDKWRFTWKNADTGEVIADSANTYSVNGSSFVEGYLSNKLLPAEGSDIIAEPGQYTASFYHNGELVGTSGFTIEEPEVSILKVGFYKGMDDNRNPVQEAKVFYQNDEIYAAVELDYKIEGDTYSTKWFQDEILLGEEEYIIEENSFIPGYIIFQLVNEDLSPFPVNSYKVQVLSSGEVQGEYFFDVIPLEYSEDIFVGGVFYQDEDSGFGVIYPDNWSLDEEDIEAGLKIKFTPDDGIRQIIINMWALKEDYSPTPDDYSDFADDLLAEQKGQEEGEDIQKTESMETIGDLEIFEVRYDNIDEAGGGWSMTFNFLKKDSLLFLFMRLTDPAYIEYGESVVSHMIDSINFNE